MSNPVAVLRLGQHLRKSTSSDRTRKAIEQGHIWPAFQPLCDLATGALVGFEVLSRWSDPRKGDIPPVRFIAEAERDGSIEEIRRHIIGQACAMAASAPGAFTLAFNLSPVEFQNPHLFRDLIDDISASGFPLHRVHLEVTESALLDEDARTRILIEQFKSVGFGVALDDFGTGYSSLSRLHAFPFDTLKIDRSFVEKLASDRQSRRIVTSIVGLAQSLGMCAVAEGVETIQQSEILRDLGCDVGQGWLFGKPQRWDLANQLLHGATANRVARPGKMPAFERLYQLDELYRTAPVGLCFLDIQLRHVNVNERFARLIGKPVDEILGKTIADLWPPDEAREISEKLTRVLSGELVPPTERKFHDRGTYRVVNALVRDAGGEPLGISSAAIEITL